MSAAGMASNGTAPVGQVSDHSHLYSLCVGLPLVYGDDKDLEGEHVKEGSFSMTPNPSSTPVVMPCLCSLF
jgi:hypothetical protein